MWKDRFCQSQTSNSNENRTTNEENDLRSNFNGICLESSKKRKTQKWCSCNFSIRRNATSAHTHYIANSVGCTATFEMIFALRLAIFSRNGFSTLNDAMRCHLNCAFKLLYFQFRFLFAYLFVCLFTDDIGQFPSIPNRIQWHWQYHPVLSYKIAKFSETSEFYY